MAAGIVYFSDCELSCGNFAAQRGGGASGDIVFGVSGPLTGPNAEYGQIWKKAFDIAVDEVNAKGGVKGRKIKIQFEDTQSDPKQSVVVAEKFVNDKSIVAEIGDFASPASMAASPIYERAGLVQYGFTNSHPDFTKGGNFMFSTAPNQADDAPFLAEYAVKDLNKKKLVLLHLNTDWGKTTANLFEARAKELGATIVYRDAYLPDEKDFKTIVTKARDANPDGLALMSYYTDAALIAQQARAQGLTVDIIANGATYSPKFIELGGAAVEGVYTTSPWFVGNPRPAVQEFVKKFKEKYIEADVTRMLDQFPRLKERWSQLGGTLSGGEQQMLAMARALMSRPKMICMDEPSMGLAPQLVEQIYELIGQIRSQGMTVLVVEQSAHVALEIADRAYVLQNGVMRLEGPARDLLANDEVRRAYLGEVV